MRDVNLIWWILFHTLKSSSIGESIIEEGDSDGGWVNTHSATESANPDTTDAPAAEPTAATTTTAGNDDDDEDDDDEAMDMEAFEEAGMLDDAATVDSTPKPKV